jgi:predicted Fe-Mo cluster-binding NifX family protein
MSHLVALTTKDGKVVQEHFGHADHFHIVRIDGDGYTYLESRAIEPRCTGEGHDNTRWEPVIELLSDCEAIVTAQIGPSAAQHMLSHGFRIFEGRGFVDEILTQIVTNNLLEEKE